jgi:hypothetical protein
MKEEIVVMRIIIKEFRGGGRIGSKSGSKSEPLGIDMG